MNKLKINSINMLIVIKTILSIFITYLILSKGDAGIIINNIGNFIVSGNGLVGLTMLLSIFALCPAIVYNFTQINNNLQKISNSLLCFDGILICVNLFFGILYNIKFLNMPIADAFAKFIILANGSAVIYILMTICVLLLIKYLSHIENEEIEDKIKINNIPLCFNGRIERKPYFITKTIFYIFLITIGFIKQQYSKDMFDLYEIIYLISMQVIFILSFYTASKRLRDIKWSQWFLVLWSIPILGICIGLPLIFVKGKFVNSNVEKF